MVAHPHLVRWVLRQGGHPHEHPNIPPPLLEKKLDLRVFSTFLDVFCFFPGFVPEVPGGPWRFLEVPGAPWSSLGIENWNFQFLFVLFLTFVDFFQLFLLFFNFCPRGPRRSLELPKGPWSSLELYGDRKGVVFL